jgi:PKD repeat protein
MNNTLLFQSWLLGLSLLFSTSSAFAQVDVLWDKTYGGSGDEIMYSSVSGADGGYLLAGFSSSPASGEKSENSRGGSDYWIVNIDTNGNKKWDRTFGGNGSEYISQAISTTNRGYLLAGSSDSNISGEKSEKSRGESDYWIIKTDAEGNKQWDRTIGGAGTDELRSVVTTIDGGYLLGGRSESNTSGEKSEDSQESDYWIVKIDQDGDKVWDKTFGGSGDEQLGDVIPSNDGGYLLAGWSDSDASGEKSEGSKGEEDYWIIKINDSGDVVWDKTIGGNNRDVLFKAISIPTGGYLLVGYSESDASGDKSADGKGGRDYWIVKVDESGNKIWDRAWGGSQDDDLRDAISIPDGGYLLTGFSASDVSADKGEDSRGANDFWVIKIDANGNKVWDKTLGGSDSDILFSAIPALDRGYLLGGYSESNTSGEKTEDSRGGEGDFWVIKVAEQETISFRLIDARADQPLRDLADGDKINTIGLPGNLAIEALVSESVGSLRIEVKGPGINTARNQSDAPYASFGDTDGDFRGKTFSPGTYTVKATPYSGRNATGEAGTPAQIAFEITEEVPDIAGFRVIDAELSEGLFGDRTFTDGIGVNICTLPERVAIEAIPSGEVGSVHIQVEGPGISTQVIEHIAPFASFGDDDGDFVGRPFSAGTYRITATPYSQRDAKGVAGETAEFILEVEAENIPNSAFTADPDNGVAPLAVDFAAAQRDPFGYEFTYFVDFGDGRSGLVGDRFSNTYTQAGTYAVTLTVTDNGTGCSSSTSHTISVHPNFSPVAGFRLVDAHTDLPFADITQGSVIDTYRLPESLAIEALISESVGSLKIEVMGPGINTSRNQSDAPYASFGDASGDFKGMAFSEGVYTVKATPYSDRNATGEAGTPLEITFEIISEPSFLFIGARGTESAGEFPHFNVLVNGEFVGDAVASDEPGQEFFFSFDVPARQIETVAIQYDNDAEGRSLSVSLLAINEGDPLFEAIFVTPFGSSVVYDRGPLDGQEVVPAPDGEMDVSGTLIFMLDWSDYARYTPVAVKKSVGTKTEIFSEEVFFALADEQLLIYPNPARSYVEVSLPLLHDQVYTLQLYDLYGREVFRQQGAGSVTESIPLNSQPRGTYLVAVQTGGQRLVQKLLITE